MAKGNSVPKVKWRLSPFPKTGFENGRIDKPDFVAAETWIRGLRTPPQRIGQTTCLGIGGDPIIGTNFIDALTLFQEDPETKAVVMIGEIGGTAEEDAANFVKTKMNKPVVGFIAGQTAPPGKRMGHAGAIISGGSGTAAEKIKALGEAGIPVARIPSEVGPLMKEALGL